VKEFVVLVNENDEEIGIEEKLNAHVKRLLHRGFVTLLFNEKNELLLVKRSREKPGWPGYWDGVASHPRPNESYEQAAERRLKEEVGISAKVNLHSKFIYKARYGNSDYVEHEVCAIIIAESSKSLSQMKLKFPNLDMIP
jgi:isopentenyl-diphosphate delta-isomerase